MSTQDPILTEFASASPLLASEQHEALGTSPSDQSASWLAAIVQSSDDAIVSKDLDGIIMTWNRGAERIFGYKAEEVIGKPVTILMPPDRVHEEPGILARIRTGQRIEHYETVRQRKDGTRIDISLTVSPVRDQAGRIIGASKIARDITARKRTEAAIAESERRLHDLLAAIPAAIYTTDAEGTITYFNEAAVELAGRRPAAGDKWCVTWKLAWPDGTPLPHDQCPMAIALREGRAVRGKEALAERPDGTRVPFIPFPTPLRDAEGKITGAINMLVDITERKRSEQLLRESEQQLSRELAAARHMQQISTRLVQAGDSSTLLAEMLDAAIELSHADMGNIQLLEHGVLKIVAQRGFEAPFLEFFGSVHDGMAACGAALQRGERIIVEDVSTSEIFQGTLALPVMLEANARAVQSTPLISRSGDIIGMFSTHFKTPHRPTEHELRMLDVLARQAADLLELRQSEATQRLLLNELNHRVKNTLAVVQAIAQRTLARTSDPKAFAADFGGRIQSLARVHTLLSNTSWQGADLRELVRDQVLSGSVDETKVTAWGPAVRLDPQMALHLALMLHELGTNSTKHGALSLAGGWVTVNWTTDDALHLRWVERGGPPVTTPSKRGFGMTLIEQSAKARGGNARMSCEAEGISWAIDLPLSEQADLNAERGALQPRASTPEVSSRLEKSANLAGRRFLVVEDEPLIGLDIVAALEDAKAKVEGPIGTVEKACEIIGGSPLDGALLDANLNGRPVDDIARTLTRQHVPFVFLTGHGRDGLPENFREVAILSKPCSRQQIIDAAANLVAPTGKVVRLKVK